MSKYRILDAGTTPLKNTRKLADGYLVADAFVARAGVQLYRGSEVGLPDKEIVRVYRPESEVRDTNSLRSFSHAPITIGHPKEDVTSRNVKDLAVGEVSTEVVWQDNKIKIPLILKDQAAVEMVEGGTRELSPGYAAEIEFSPGVTPEGEEYDAVQRNIRINHLAIVAKGRSGSEVRIGDEAADWGASPIHNAAKEKPMTLRTLLVDGLSVETTDAGAQAIEKVQKQLVDAEAKAKGDMDAKDRRIAELEAELDKAKKSKMSDEALSELVGKRAVLLGDARMICKDELPGSLSNEEIRRKAVAAKLGDDAVKDKSDAYLEVRFDDLVMEAKKTEPDPVTKAIRDSAAAPTSPSGSWDAVSKANGYNA